MRPAPRMETATHPPHLPSVHQQSNFKIAPSSPPPTLPPIVPSSSPRPNSLAQFLCIKPSSKPRCPPHIHLSISHTHHRTLTYPHQHSHISHNPNSITQPPSNPMTQPNGPDGQPRRRAPNPPLWGPQLKIVLAILAILLFWKIASFLYTAHLHFNEHSGALYWNTPPRIKEINIPHDDAGVISGRDIPLTQCEEPPGGVAAGLPLPSCGLEVRDGVCVVRSCPDVNAGDAAAEADTENAGPPPPTGKLAGTPTVENAGAWWWQKKSVRNVGAECTGPCSPEGDGKSVSSSYLSLLYHRAVLPLTEWI